MYAEARKQRERIYNDFIAEKAANSAKEAAALERRQQKKQEYCERRAGSFYDLFFGKDGC